MASVLGAGVLIIAVCPACWWGRHDGLSPWDPLEGELHPVLQAQCRSGWGPDTR